MRLGGFAFAILLFGIANRRPARPETPEAMESAALSPVLAKVRPALDRRPMRPVYPYSVIRGGVYSAAEFNAALRLDSVASAHYAGFHRQSLRMTSAPEPIPLYASYRIGNSVFWTSHPIHIAAGEPLITDGTYLARARCGNRLSDSPRGPVSRMEPSESEMETPEPLDLPGPAVADSGVGDELSAPHPPPGPGFALAFEVFSDASLAGSGPSSDAFGNVSAQGQGAYLSTSNTGEPSERDQSSAQAVWPGTIMGVEGFPDDSPWTGGGGKNPWQPTTSAGGSPPITGAPVPGEPGPPFGNSDSSDPGSHSVPEPVSGALLCAGLAFLCVAARWFTPSLR
jgi:hypothetical protein